jgi:hypothetical protein
MSTIKTYQSIKKVKARPMDKATAIGHNLVRDKEGDNEDGYIVMYEDGYKSWSPKEVFENGYKEIEVCR